MMNEFINSFQWKLLLKNNYNKLFLIAIVFLFCIVHFTNDTIIKYLHLLNINDSYLKLINKNWDIIVNGGIYPFKKVLFILSFLVLGYPIYKEINAWKRIRKQLKNKNNYFIILFLSLLVTPFFIESMGLRYGFFSSNPFHVDLGIYNRRILMPILGHLIALEGAFYFFFSLILTFSLLILIKLWLENNQVYLKDYQLASLLTSSFFIFQFQFPGYPDVLLFILLLFSISFQISDRSKISLFIFALLVHEASIFISLILAYFALNKRKNFYYFFCIVLLYTFIWILSYGSIELAFEAHDVAGLSGFEWVIKRPQFEILGLFFSYKLLWIYIFIAVIHLITKKKLYHLFLIISLLTSGVLLTFLGTDTSRLMGWSFIALLLCIKIIHHSPSLLTEYHNKYIYTLNLFVPSLYVGTNTGIVNNIGFYYLYDLIYGVFS